MRYPTRKLQRLMAAAALVGGMAGNAQAALDLTGLTYVTYGDANSYALQVSGEIIGSTGPGSPLYVNSTPGAIQDLIVVATGASGNPVNTNVAGMDDALSTPNGTGGSNFFSGIWNSTLEAFTGFLDGEDPLFFFNNNQTKSGSSLDENVAVWAQISLTGDGLDTIYFDLTNMGGKYALFTEGGGGQFTGDVTLYTSGGAGPLAGTNSATDYVLSGGAICLTTTDTTGSGGFPVNTPVSCSSPLPHTAPINNNLGANQAAYAIDVPELNAFLAAWNSSSGYTDIHIDLRFGCDPLTGSTAGTGDCIGRDANNGYEQVFIGTSTTVVQVPEPGSLALLGLGMLALAGRLAWHRKTGKA